jgi:CheY-like chemotaxis protein/HPt (histidine-containing phosphotransfer) domain-containing protein
MLAAWGMKVAAAVDARSALGTLSRAHQSGSPFRLVITDMQMPEIDGFGLCKAIRSNGEFGSVPILILSSSVRPGESARSTELQIAGYLMRPAQPSELLDAVLAAVSNSSGPSQTLKSNAVEAQAPKAKRKILLAEDNVVNRKLAVALLEKRGFTVVVTENGREAIEALEREPVDLVLMDVQMPVMDGLEAMRTIRASEQSSGAHLPIIALTAHAMKGDRERCLAAGADDYVSKPIRMGELLAAMDRATETRANARETNGVSATSPPAPALSDVPAPPSLDLAAALDRVEGDRELLEEIARLFADECPGLIDSIRRARQENDIPLLQRAAHTLKGAASNIAAMKVAEAALALEAQARSGQIGNTDELIAALASQVDLVLPEIDALCRKVAHGNER